MQNAAPFWTAHGSREIFEVVRNFPKRPVILSSHPSLPPRIIFGDDDITPVSILASVESPMGAVELSVAEFGLRRTVVDTEERRKSIESIMDAVAFIADEFAVYNKTDTHELCVTAVNPLLPSLPVPVRDRLSLMVSVRVALVRSNILTVEVVVRPRTLLWLNQLAKDKVPKPSS